jgi:hypothetical protein
MFIHLDEIVFFYMTYTLFIRRSGIAQAIVGGSWPDGRKARYPSVAAKTAVSRKIEGYPAQSHRS